MKHYLWLKAACIGFVLTVIYSFIPFQASCADVTRDSFRLHILADSDSREDQALKLRVRDRLLKETGELFSSAKSKDEAIRLTAQKLQSLANTAYDEVRRSGYDYTVKAEITNMYFTTRRYKSYTLPSGMYDALRITIGSGKGHNWWCVMYPSLCVTAAENQDERAREAFDDGEYRVVHDEQPEYKFKIIEIFEKLRSFFA